jgi:hypothetical protein
MLARGERIRLTDHEADDAEPSFADGTKIVLFRPEGVGSTRHRLVKKRIAAL